MVERDHQREREERGGPDPAAASREQIRAADVDREFVAERLRSGLNEGRLSLSEYDERLRDAYLACTYGDLDRILSDLPGPEHSALVPTAPAAPAPAPVPASTPTPAVTPAVPPAPAARGAVPRWLAAVWSAWLTAVLVNVAIWAIVSLSARELIYFWPIWVAGPWGAVLVATTISGLLGGEPHRTDDKRARRKARRDERRR